MSVDESSKERFQKKNLILIYSFLLITPNDNCFYPFKVKLSIQCNQTEMNTFDGSDQKCSESMLYFDNRMFFSCTLFLS